MSLSLLFFSLSSLGSFSLSPLSFFSFFSCSQPVFHLAAQAEPRMNRAEQGFVVCPLRYVWSCGIVPVLRRTAFGLLRRTLLTRRSQTHRPPASALQNPRPLSPPQSVPADRMCPLHAVAFGRVSYKAACGRELLCETCARRRSTAGGSHLMLLVSLLLLSHSNPTPTAHTVSHSGSWA